MAKTIVGLFEDYAQAQRAANELERSGFTRDDVSMVAAETTRDRHHGSGVTEGAHPTHTAERIGIGAGVGATAGGLAGLLVGIGALAIPGVGPLVAAGPIVAVLAGAGVGAAAGGLIGALTALGVPDEHARYYNEAIERGGTLVTVRADDNRARLAADVLTGAGAVDVERQSERWRAEQLDSTTGDGHRARSQTTARTEAWRAEQVNSTTGDGHPARGQVGAREVHGGGGLHDTSPRAFDQGGGADLGLDGDRSFDRLSREFRADWETNHATAGRSYEDMQPAYRYGYDLSSDRRYSGREWNDIEGEARTHWETQRPGTWEQVKDGIRHAWDSVRGHDTPGRH